jgi:hypothetical protein
MENFGIQDEEGSNSQANLQEDQSKDEPTKFNNKKGIPHRTT